MTLALEQINGTSLKLLREQIADFTVDAVFAALGDEAWLALARNETVPALRQTTNPTPLNTLIRLFSLQVPVSEHQVFQALGPVAEPLIAAGILRRSGSEITATIDLRPYGDEDHNWWVACDLTPGLNGVHRPMRADHVLGISEASSSLAQLTLREPVDTALDLGTGCGVQALHLAQHARQVVATDVNDRALELARFTAALNGVSFEVRHGSLFEPVPKQTFDLIVTNPPFVVSPPQHERLVYRETGFEADEVVRRVVSGAAEHLNPGGWCQVLASWLHTETEPWQDRLAEWIAPTGLDAWVVQREQADLSQYIEMWLADAGLRGSPHYTARYDEWLSWFDQQGVNAVGFGWINLRKADRQTPHVTIEHLAQEVSQPVSEAVRRWATSADVLAVTDDVLQRAWHVAADVRQHTAGLVGADDPASITINQRGGVRRTRQLDTVEAGLLSVSDGQLTAGQALDALAELLETDKQELRQTYTPVIRELVAEGYLEARP